MNKQGLKKKNGVTLIALVVTVVVLLILSAVIIKITLGRNGVVEKTTIAKNEELNKEEYKNTEISELYNKTTTGEIVNNVVKNTEADNTPPEISIKDVKSNGFSVLITDEGSGVKYYAVTVDSKEPAQYTLVEPISKTFTKSETNFIQDTTYYIWTKDANGNMAKTNLKTGIVPALTSSNSTFSNNPSTWTSQNVSTTITTTEIGYTLQYQIGSTTGTWTDYSTAISIENNTNVYARLWDGTNAGTPNYGNITNIDKVAPSAPTYEAYFEDGSGAYTIGTWTNKKVRTKISTTEATSGVNKIQYSTDKTNWSTFNFSARNGIVANGTDYYGIEPWTLSDRNQTYYFRAVDVAGNTSSISSAFILKYDTTSPTVPTLTNSSSGNWTKANVTITGSATDSLSGIQGYQYSYDNSTWNTWDGSSTWSTEMNKTFYARAIDNAGNVGTAASTVVHIDKTAPSVVTLSNSSGGNWTKANVTITGSATDSLSGIQGYQYSYDNSTWSTWDASSTWSSEISKTFYARAIDNAGNAGAVASTGLHIDKTTPSVVTLSNSSGGNWTAGNVTITGSATDSLSGIQGYQYSYDNSTWNTWSAGTTWSSQISKTFYARAIDNAGNVGAVASTGLHIDKTGPTTPTLTNTSGGNWSAANVFVTATSTDSLSGLSTYQYSYDNSSWSAWEGSISNGVATDGWSAERNSTVYIRAIDKAGNASASASTGIHIDKTPPTTPSLSNSSGGEMVIWGTGVTITATSSDARSGIKTFQYSYDNSTWNAWEGSISGGTATDTWTAPRQQNIYIRAIDNVGNTSASSSTPIMIAEQYNDGHTHTFGNSYNDCSANYPNYKIAPYTSSFYWTCTNGHSHYASEGSNGVYQRCIYCGYTKVELKDMGYSLSGGTLWCPNGVL